MPITHRPLPIQGDNDPRIPLYRALREEWKMKGRRTDAYNKLEADAKAMTVRMLEDLEPRDVR